MCKACKSKKKKQHKFAKRIKLSLGLLTGGALGMLYAPKKGEEMRKYFKSPEFKNKLKKARNKAQEAKEFAQDKAMVAKSSFQRFWIGIRKRFGM